MRIAFVEDDDLQAKVITKWLSEELGAEVTRYSASEEFYAAQQTAAFVPPEIIIVDYYLGGDNGDAFIDRLRAGPEPTASAGVVLTSGLSAAAFLKIIRTADVDSYMMKDQINRNSLCIAVLVAAKTAKLRHELCALRTAQGTAQGTAQSPKQPAPAKHQPETA